MTTVIFDLDGTLLPMDQNLFIKKYFDELVKKFVPFGFDAKALIKAVWAGTEAMIKNGGTITNEQCFWNTFAGILGEEVRSFVPDFINFYQTEFNKVKDVTAPTFLAQACVKSLKEKNYSLVLATNPIFPRIATYSRIEWAGLNPNDFILISSYENFGFSKPNLMYYREILKIINKNAGECVMVGNDVKEDMAAHKIGMQTYLLLDNCINDENEDITKYHQGSFNDLYEWIKNLPVIIK